MKNIIVLFSLCLIFPFVALAADKPVWVEATGEARLGDVDTKKEVRARARQDAQSKAVEMAVGTFIKSHTLVSNSQVAEDLIYAAVRGKIIKEKMIADGWDEKDRELYKMTIKALVQPVYPEKGGGLSVKLSLSKTDLKEGDEVKIFYQVSEEAYVYIFSVAADGSVTLLVPNAHMQDHFAKAGIAYQFPSPESRVELKAMFLPNYPGTVAEEKIKIVATKKNEALLSLGFKEGSFNVYDEKSTGMISDLVRRLNSIDLSDWTEATAVYHIKR